MNQKLYLKNILISLLFYIYSNIQSTNSEPIRGVTIRNWPYANQLENGQFEGFVVDILNEISSIAKITYTLTLSANKEYGGWTKNGSVSGMIGQVYRKEYDFAIGDITVLSTRDRYVDFSLPFMKFGLSALIRKVYIGNMSSFQDLSEQTEIAYGVKKTGANLPLFHESPIVTKMYNYMDANPSSFVKGEKEAIKRVKTSKYAFITESPFNEYVINRDCDLTVINDKQKLFEFEYAIAMRGDLPERYVISDALRDMKKSGKLNELKDKYWKTEKCTEDSNVREIDPKSARLSEREERDHKDKKHWHHKKHHKKDNSFSHTLSQTLIVFLIVFYTLFQ